MRQAIADWTRVVAVAAMASLGLSALHAQEAVVRIGHAGPTSGPIAHLGKDSELGARLAVEELNSRGVVIGGRKTKIELVAEDDAGDPKQGVAVASKLVDARVAGVVGHLHSGTSIPASRVYADAGIPQISPGASNPKLTGQGLRTVFRLVPTDSDVLAAAASFAGRWGARTLVLKAPTNAGIDGLQRKVDRVRPETIVYDGPLHEALLLGRSDVKTIVTTDCGGANLSVRAAVYCASSEPNYQRPSAALDEFRRRFQSKFNVSPLIVAPYSYDAVKLMVAAMEKAGSADPRRYLPVLAKTANYAGVTGAITFNDRGDLVRPRVNVFELRNGEWNFDRSIEVNAGSDGGCSDSCEFCCSDKDGRFCAKDDKCRR